MHYWEKLLRKHIVDAEQLSQKYSDINREAIERVTQVFPMRINPYYLSLIEERNDPIWKQCVPDIKELKDESGTDDPLHEEKDSPVPGLVHRYPDRVLLLVSNQCAMYCRFCTRKRRVGKPLRRITKEGIIKGIEYIRGRPEIRDVILSGGDPLLLQDEDLEFVLKQIREIKHVQIIRIGTRVPCTLPHRITPELCSMLKKYHPLYLNTHFNHPREVTPEAERACEMLADAGIPLGNQSVLLKGVNDSSSVIKELMQKLLTIRVKPYYLYQADLTRGTEHFRTQTSKGTEIIKPLIEFKMGLAIPHFIIDAPGGGGKIPILPSDITRLNGKEVYEFREMAKDKIMEGLDYIRNSSHIKHVVLSGEPFTLKDDELELILSELKNTGRVEVIKINTHILRENPDRITPQLCSMLRKYNPIYVNTQFNHPDELTSEAVAAAGRLADSGIPLGNQTTLQTGLNDDPTVMRELSHTLLINRIKPFFIDGRKVPLETGIRVIENLRGFTSGLAVPHLIVENQNGVPVPAGPNYIVRQDKDRVILKNYAGKTFEYLEPRQYRYRALLESTS